jgi:hypothetical protein
MESGRHGARSIATALVIASIVPLLVARLAGVGGQSLQAGPVYAMRVLGHGAPMPGYGMLSWGDFLWLEGLAAVAGGLTGAACGLVVRHGAGGSRGAPHRRPGSRETAGGRLQG